jgi:hypothetical protein
MATSTTRHGAVGQARQAKRGGAGHGMARLGPAQQAKGNGAELILPVTDWSDVPPLPQQHVVISPPSFQEASVSIKGTSPYVQHKFSEKARKIMEDRMIEGSRGKNVRRAKAPRKFNEEYEAAMHKTADGRHGIPAPGFRSALISACRLVGFSRPMARLSIFVQADGIDQESGMPLVYLVGTPKIFPAPVRIGQTTSTVWRPMWEEWSCVLRLRWDADQFLPQDVINLVARAGGQVGVGEGRPDSKNSDGLGYGLWEVIK